MARARKVAIPVHSGSSKAPGSGSRSQCVETCWVTRGIRTVRVRDRRPLASVGDRIAAALIDGFFLCGWDRGRLPSWPCRRGRSPASRCPRPLGQTAAGLPRPLRWHLRSPSRGRVTSTPFAPGIAAAKERGSVRSERFRGTAPRCRCRPLSKPDSRLATGRRGGRSRPDRRTGRVL